MFAILAVWIALGALITTIIVVLLPDQSAETVVTLLPYTIALSATLAAGVLWAFRKRDVDEPGVAGQRTQATAALIMNSLSFAILLFALQDFQYALIGLAVEGGFLWFCWWGYRRVVLQEK